jgi:hypothetical protein
MSLLKQRCKQCGTQSSQPLNPSPNKPGFAMVTGLGMLTLLIFLNLPIPAQAWVLTVAPGTRAIFLQVGNGANNASNATINQVSVTVPAIAVGNAAPQVMTTNSTQANSFFDNFATCNVPAQMYVGGYFRQPTTTTSVASLQVTSPTALTSGTDTIPFNEISWTSTANGNVAADIPAGTFTGGAQFLVNIPSNRWLENCHTFSYANTTVAPAGTFTGRVVYTLVAP